MTTSRKHNTRKMPEYVLAQADAAPPKYVPRTRGILKREEPGDPIVYFLTITPRMAATWLLHCNPVNRNEREKRIAGMAVDIAKKKWGINGATICRDKNGMVLDGQNRLHACAKAGYEEADPSTVSIRVIMVDDLETSSQDSMDDIAARQTRDDLRRRGLPRVTVTQSLLMRILAWEHSKEHSPDGSGRYLDTTDYRPTKQQQLELVDAGGAALELILESTRVGEQSYAKLNRISKAAIAFCFWLLTQIDEQEAKFFFEQLLFEKATVIEPGKPARIVALIVDSPIHKLRTAIIARKNSSLITHETWFVAAIIQGWNNHLEGSRRGIKVQLGGSHAKAFPQPNHPDD